MDSALNRAHQQERKANLLFRSRKFDEAIACHQKCAELLNEAMQLTNVSQALESLKLQHDYHINRKKVIRYKQNLLEKIKAVNKQMAKLAVNEHAVASKLEDDKEEVTATLSNSRRMVNEIQNAIYRHIDENDSLLRGLITGDFETPFSKDLCQILPQDDKMIIEELRINNSELRGFVDQLSMQLEQSREDNRSLKMENEFLRRQLQHYEMERSKPHTATNTDSSSPYIFSPSGDLSPEIFHTIQHMPPLEMPNFDLYRFSSSTDDNGTENETSNHEEYH